MFNDLTPPYLSSLVPPLVQNASCYNLRNSNDTQTIASRTTLFYNSFLPSSIRDWNRLNPDIRNAGTLDAFKLKLNQNLPVIPKHYYSGITQYCNMTLDVLLRGDERLSTNINTTIFEAVHKYIQKSK